MYQFTIWHNPAVRRRGFDPRCGGALAVTQAWPHRLELFSPPILLFVGGGDRLPTPTDSSFLPLTYPVETT